MSQWTEWEALRHQVAVAGRVVDGREKPIAGAEVTLTTMPKADKTEERWHGDRWTRVGRAMRPHVDKGRRYFLLFGLAGRGICRAM